jgi:hypothetical protein
MNTARVTLVFIALAAAALVALLIAGSSTLVLRTFALDSANELPVAVVGQSGPVCEGPITSQGQAQAVEVWGAAVAAPAQLTVVVQDASTGEPLSAGRLDATTVPSAYTARLVAPVAGGRPLRVCLIPDRGSVTLLGSPAVHPNIVLTGGKPGLEYSLALLDETGQSLLGSLRRAFSRASLFRPTWMGSWTFWLLAAALLGTVALGAVAIGAAASADNARRTGAAPPDREPNRQETSA